MQSITEEMKIHEQWYKEAKDQNLETLQTFINHLLNDYKHDYGTICHALSAGAIATAIAMNRSGLGGITGYQAGFVMWGFIRHWMIKEGTLRLISYDDMLYPQYEHKFEKTITEEIWTELQTKAKKLLEENNFNTVHPDVVSHWKKIASGIVPFGYTILNED